MQPSKTKLNEYGVEVSVHECAGGCGEFTVCPPVKERPENWLFCMSRNCPGYDPKRDVDRIIEDEPYRLPFTISDEDSPDM